MEGLLITVWLLLVHQLCDSGSIHSDLEPKASEREQRCFNGHVFDTGTTQLLCESGYCFSHGLFKLAKHKVRDLVVSIIVTVLWQLLQGWSVIMDAVCLTKQLLAHSLHRRLFLFLSKAEKKVIKRTRRAERKWKTI